MAWGATEELALDGFRYADLTSDKVLPRATGTYATAPTRPGVDDIVEDVDTLGILRGLLLRGVILAQDNELAPSIATDTITIATGACLLDGHVHINGASLDLQFVAESAATYYVWVEHTATAGVYSASLGHDTSLPSEPYILLATVDWDGADLSNLVDERRRHQASPSRGPAQTTFYLGRGQDETIYLYADNADANLPGIRYNSSTNQWEASHDGSTWGAIGNGGSLPSADWGEFYFKGETAVEALAVGTAGQVLTSGGADADPSWTTPAGAGDVLQDGAVTAGNVAKWTGDGTVGDAGVAVSNVEQKSNKDTANGYAGLGATSKLAVSQLPVMVGDSGSGGTAGAVPSPAAGDAAAGKFLKADGTWADPDLDTSGYVTIATEQTITGLKTFSGQEAQDAWLKLTVDQPTYGSTTDTGYTSGGTYANDASYGSKAFTGASNAAAEDDTYAAAFQDVAVSVETNYLKATGFGFSLPINAQVVGVEVRLGAYCNTGTSAVTHSVRLVVADTVTGDDLAGDESLPASDDDSYDTYGSSAQLWGLSLTPAQVNAAGFGVVVAFTLPGEEQGVDVDLLQLRVYYREVTGSAAVDYSVGVTIGDWATPGDELFVISEGGDLTDPKLTIDADGTVAITDLLKLPGLTSDPTAPADGSIWYRTDTNAFRGRVNGAMVTFDVTPD